MKPRWLLSTNLVVAALAASLSNSATAYPQISSPADFEVAGAPLQDVLTSLSGKYQVRLGTTGELRTQRVTLVGKEVSLRFVSEALQKLLSAPNDAGVNWAQDANGSWILQESLNRRKLTQLLKDSDLLLF